VSKIKAEEITKESSALFEKFKSKWEKNDKSKEVHQESIVVLTKIMDNLKNSPNLKSIETMDLLGKVEEILNARVSKKIYYEFQRKVDEESNRKLKEKFDGLKEREWKIWLDVKLQPIIDQLVGTSIDNVYRFLQGPWDIRCDKCGTEQSIQMLRKDEVPLMIMDKGFLAKCINANCRDLLGRHIIKITLSDLIATKLPQQSTALPGQ